MTTTPTDPLSLITWHGPDETWPWPFSFAQMERLSTCPQSVDGIVQVVAIGPDCPDLILAIGAETSPNEIRYICGAGKDGDRWRVRFGQMQMADFTSMPEHEGW